MIDFSGFLPERVEKQEKDFPFHSTEMSYFLPTIWMAQNKQFLTCIVWRQEGSFFTEIIRNCYLKSWHWINLWISLLSWNTGIPLSPECWLTTVCLSSLYFNDWFLWFSARENRKAWERFSIFSTEMSYFLPTISMAQNKQLLTCIVYGAMKEVFF